MVIGSHRPLGVDAPPGFRIRWGFVFVVDELTTRFFFRGTSSGAGGLNTEESIRPLRRKEFVGNGGTGVADLDSAKMYEWLVDFWGGGRWLRTSQIVTRWFPRWFPSKRAFRVTWILLWWFWIRGAGHPNNLGLDPKPCLLVTVQGEVLKSIELRPITI